VNENKQNLILIQKIFESENMSSFVVSSLKKIKIKELKVMLWLYIPGILEIG
jgi:hypothetical protein